MVRPRVDQLLGESGAFGTEDEGLYRGAGLLESYDAESENVRGILYMTGIRGVSDLGQAVKWFRPLQTTAAKRVHSCVDDSSGD